MITDEAIAEAWDRIARTPDGAIVYAHLQAEAIGILKVPDPSDGALRAAHGRRSLAHQLMGLMAKGIDESGGRTDDTGGKRSERPVVFLAREPVRTSDRREPKRAYLLRTDPELNPGGGSDAA